MKKHTAPKSSMVEFLETAYEEIYANLGIPDDKRAEQLAFVKERAEEHGMSAEDIEAIRQRFAERPSVERIADAYIQNLGDHIPRHSPLWAAAKKEATEFLAKAHESYRALVAQRVEELLRESRTIPELSEVFGQAMREVLSTRNPGREKE